jgi:hypothetical protein
MDTFEHPEFWGIAGYFQRDWRRVKATVRHAKEHVALKCGAAEMKLRESHAKIAYEHTQAMVTGRGKWKAWLSVPFTVEELNCLIEFYVDNPSYQQAHFERTERVVLTEYHRKLSFDMCLARGLLLEALRDKRCDEGLEVTPKLVAHIFDLYEEPVLRQIRQVRYRRQAEGQPDEQRVLEEIREQTRRNVDKHIYK